jgi:hypothetical protein
MAKVDSLEKLSEKVSKVPAASTTGCRKEAVWPFSCSVYRPNPRSERCSYPFSDSFSQRIAVMVAPLPALVTFPLDSGSYLSRLGYLTAVFMSIDPVGGSRSEQTILPRLRA